MQQNDSLVRGERAPGQRRSERNADADGRAGRQKVPLLARARDELQPVLLAQELRAERL